LESKLNNLKEELEHSKKRRSILEQMLQ